MKHKLILVLILLSTLTLGLYKRVTAHAHTQVGDYELVIGFHNEPAYQGEPNGLDLFVTDTRTGEMVNGLEETLRAEIIFGGAKKELSLEPQFGQDGAYTAHVLPTETGDYTWHIFGTINDTPVDVSMTSSPDTFGSVEPKSVVSFPSAELSSAELADVSRSAGRTAQIALLVGAAGLIFGLAGLVVGFLGVQASRQRVGLTAAGTPRIESDR